MFERFTERARQVIVLAEEEARILNHDYIGTEHILLGLLREKEGLAARALESFGITVERVRAQVVRIVGAGEEEVTSGQIPFTPRSKKVLELSLREALALGHNYIGTEHILLGVARENEGVAGRILDDFDADSEKIRNEIIRMLSGPGGRQQGGAQSEMGGVSLEAIGLGDLVLDGAAGPLRVLIAEIRERTDREPDAGDLLVLLASVPDGLAARALAALGIDAEKLAAAARDARRDDAISELLPASERTAEIERVREEREAALAKADELGRHERELLEQALADLEIRQGEVLGEVRTLLDLPEEGDG